MDVFLTLLLFHFQLAIAAEHQVSVVDANTYALKFVVKTHFPTTISLASLYTTLDYLITGNNGLVFRADSREGAAFRCCHGNYIDSKTMFPSSQATRTVL